MKTGIEFYLAEMPMYNDIKKKSSWSQDTIDGLWETISNEVEDVEKYYLGSLNGERVYGFDMRQFWGAGGKSFQFFVLDKQTPVFIATFFYQTEIRAWVEDDVAKTKSRNSVEGLYDFLLTAKGVGFIPKRIAGQNHSKGMEKVWKKFTKFKKTEVWERSAKNNFTQRKDLNFHTKGIWSEVPNHFYVVIEK